MGRVFQKRCCTAYTPMHFHLFSLSTSKRLKMTEHFLVASIDLFTSSFLKTSAGFIVFYR